VFTSQDIVSRAGQGLEIPYIEGSMSPRTPKLFRPCEGGKRKKNSLVDGRSPSIELWIFDDFLMKTGKKSNRTVFQEGARGFRKVLLRLAMPYHSMPCGGQPRVWPTMGRIYYFIARIPLNPP
jgi:hypothetical protein